MLISCFKNDAIIVLRGSAIKFNLGCSRCCLAPNFPKWPNVRRRMKLQSSKISKHFHENLPLKLISFSPSALTFSMTSVHLIDPTVNHVMLQIMKLHRVWFIQMSWGNLCIFVPRGQQQPGMFGKKREWGMDFIPVWLVTSELPRDKRSYYSHINNEGYPQTCLLVLSSRMEPHMIHLTWRGIFTLIKQ